jgi:HPt (histidine-containing phosphotransfer) domain-containing protein
MAPAARGASLGVGRGPIDRAHLSRYTAGDIALEQEILDLFAGQLPSTVGALKLAVTDRDWHLFAHTLKGSSRAVGAWRLAELALEAEGLREHRTPVSMALLMSEIDVAAAEVTAYVRGLKSPTAGVTAWIAALNWNWWPFKCAASYKGRLNAQSWQKSRLYNLTVNRRPSRLKPAW